MQPRDISTSAGKRGETGEQRERSEDRSRGRETHGSPHREKSAGRQPRESAARRPSSSPARAGVILDRMPALPRQLEGVDAQLTHWMARHGVPLLRVSLGIVFLWFGVLKFFPGLSPAHDLAARTIERLSFGMVGPAVSVPLLAAWECLIGLGLLFGVFLRAVLLLLAAQMLGTLTPIVLFPGEVFTRIPYAPTLEGQYIIKNAVLISAAIVLGATVRGGGLVAEPEALEAAEREERHALREAR